MIAITIHGRGGRGGVTLAKLIAGAYAHRGKFVQAFGVYGAERTGAPVQAFVRVDNVEITVHNAITAPDHVIVLEPSLLSPGLCAATSPTGWVIVNTPDAPESFAELCPGRKVATIDANTIAIAQKLGSSAVPIVNTTMLGAVARVLSLEFADVEAALRATGFEGANLVAAQQAYEHVSTAAGNGVVRPLERPRPPVSMGFLDERVGGPVATLTGSWASRRPQTRRLEAPCSQACPAGNDVRGFVAAAAEGDYDQALATLLRSSPFPGTCGRVCPAPCMSCCNRQGLDEGVDVRSLERVAADRGVWRCADLAPNAQPSVAVVGSGPAGLSAAYHLARLGHPVTVYEQMAEAGGVLRAGIPTYRLPRAVLDREIEFIAAHGVRLLTGQRMDRDALSRLAEDNAAILLATGLQNQRSVKLSGDTSLVTQGLELLEAARRGAVDLRGQAVVVVGGGNTAMDAARTAVRLGARDVRVAYRRTKEEMPAIREEIEEAAEEGVVFEELLSPIALERCDGEQLLVCRRMRLAAPDASGRPQPVPLEGDDSVRRLPCDRLVLAVGQSSDLSLLPHGAQVPPASLLTVDGVPLFCAGDFAGGEGTVAAAIGSGRGLAQTIHTSLSAGLHIAEPAEAAADVALAGPEVIRLHAFERSPRQTQEMLPAHSRRSTFDEVRRGLARSTGRDAARVEAERCLSCGVCTGCDTCVIFCPENALCRPNGSELEFDYDYCKGCGLCAAECPRGTLTTQVI